MLDVPVRRRWSASDVVDPVGILGVRPCGRIADERVRSLVVPGDLRREQQVKRLIRGRAPRLIRRSSVIWRSSTRSEIRSSSAVHDHRREVRVDGHGHGDDVLSDRLLRRLPGQDGQERSCQSVDGRAERRVLDWFVHRQFDADVLHHHLPEGRLEDGAERDAARHPLGGCLVVVDVEVAHALVSDSRLPVHAGRQVAVEPTDVPVFTSEREDGGAGVTERKVSAACRGLKRGPSRLPRPECVGCLTVQEVDA